VKPAAPGTWLAPVVSERSGSAPTRYDAGDIADDQREHDANRDVGGGVTSSPDSSVEQLVADATYNDK
jgi:hypothetical protein